MGTNKNQMGALLVKGRKNEKVILISSRWNKSQIRGSAIHSPVGGGHSFLKSEFFLPGMHIRALVYASIVQGLWEKFYQGVRRPILGPLAFGFLQCWIKLVQGL